MARLDDSFLFDDEDRLDDTFLYTDEPEKEPVVNDFAGPPEDINPDKELRYLDDTPRSSMSAREPSILDTVTDYFTDTDKRKASASNERVARDIAKRDNIPVGEVYKSVGGSRPDSEIDGPGRLQTAIGKGAQGIGSIASSAAKGASINRQATARSYIKGMEALLAGEKPEGRSALTIGGMAVNVQEMRKAEADGDTERASNLRNIINQSMDDARQLIEENPKKAELYKVGEDIDLAIKDYIKTNPEFENDFFTSKVPQGLGTMVSFAAVAALGRGAFTKAGLPGVIATTAPVASAGAVMQYSQGFEDALNYGADFETALESAERNVPLGFTEAIPIATLFNRLDKGSGGMISRSVRNAIKSGTEEALQETFQSVMSNAIAQDLYDKDRGLWNGAGDGAAVGFTTGGIVAFLGTLIGGRRSISQKKPDEIEAETDQADSPPELFNPTHKAGGGQDVQVATKNGKIVPDTYVNSEGQTVRDANAVANNPEESIDVTYDVNAVAAKIKAEISGKQGGTETVSTLPTEKADQVISSLEQGNQAFIDSEFAAPAPEISNQAVIDNQNLERTQAELNQAEIDNQTEVAPVSGQQGLPAEQIVTQDEINQKQIEGFAAQELAGETRAAQQPQQKPTLIPAEKAESQPELQKAKAKPVKRLKPKSERDAVSSEVVTETSAKEELPQQETAEISQPAEPVGETTKNIETVSNEAATSEKNELPLPTEAQKESGNYKKAHVKVQGLDITIENAKGSKREGIDPNGKKWSVNMPAAYGYFKGSVGADSKKGATGNKIEQLDTYIGNSPESQEVFIVNQQDPVTGKFDELKVIIGTENVNDAMNIYFGGFSDGTGGSRAKSVYQVPMTEFKELLNKGLGTKEIKKIDGLTNIDPSFISKLAGNAGANKLVDKTPKQTALKGKSESVPRETKPKQEVEKQPVTPSKEKEIKQEEPATGPYRAMKGKEISYEVEVQDTGETYTVTVDSETVMKDIDTRLDALNKLKDCI